MFKNILKGIIVWSMERLYSIVDSDDDGKIDQDEIEEFVILLRNKLKYIKSRLNKK